MFTDTHAHLDFPDFDIDRDDVVQRAETNDVKRIITIGTNEASCPKAIEIAEKHPNVFAAIGIHPDDAITTSDDFISELKKLAQHPKVVAIGECGLDYHRLPSKVGPAGFKNLTGITTNPEELDIKMADDEVKNRQAIVFQQQLDLAVELKLNVAIHQRDSWEDVLKIIEPYQGKLRCVFHCFGGTIDDAQYLIECGHLVSFTGIVTFKNGKQVQETAKQIPSDAFMVETDCPFLAPTPHRGKRCEPWHTRLVAEKIAELRNTSPQEISNLTESTANSFFKFGR